jgi:transcriptional regulator with XRE-family HTH domain
MGIVINSARLEREIARRGWTHEELAKVAGVSAATVAAATAGRPLAVKTVRLIAAALAATPAIDDIDSLLL